MDATEMTVAAPEATPQPQRKRDPEKKKETFSTDRGLRKALKTPAPKGKTRLVWDDDVKNLCVRITDKGYASFWVIRPQLDALNSNGKRKLVWYRLGRCDDLSLAEAQGQAKDVRLMLSRGKHPEEERQKQRLEEAARREAEARKAKNSFAGALERYFASERFKDLRTGGQIEGTLRRDFLGQTRENKKWVAGPEAVWSKTPIGDISRDTVELRLGGIKLRGGKHAARHARGALGSFYSWVTKEIEARDLGVKLSPCDGIDDEALGFGKQGKGLKRNRVLTDTELFDVWWAAKVSAYPFGPLVQLLMLNGQRRNDIAEATTKEGEIDLTDKLLTIPAERYKSGDVHKVPLSPLAVQIIEKLPKVVKATYIFSTTFGKRPISGFGKMKRKLDSFITEWREIEGREPMPAWTLHDIRRTVRTRLMSDCGADAFIAERILGHTLPGLHGVYDQGTHLQQKREALDRWAARLAQIVGLTPPSDKVVTFVEEKKRRTKGKRA